MRAVLLDYGKMDAESLLEKSEAAAAERLQLRLRSGARRGEPEIMDQARRHTKAIACHLTQRPIRTLHHTIALTPIIPVIVCHCKSLIGLMSCPPYSILMQNATETSPTYYRLTDGVRLKCGRYLCTRMCERPSTSGGSGTALRSCT